MLNLNSHRERDTNSLASLNVQRSIKKLWHNQFWPQKVDHSKYNFRHKKWNLLATRCHLAGGGVYQWAPKTFGPKVGRSSQYFPASHVSNPHPSRKKEVEKIQGDMTKFSINYHNFLYADVMQLRRLLRINCFWDHNGLSIKQWCPRDDLTSFNNSLWVNLRSGGKHPAWPLIYYIEVVPVRFFYRLCTLKTLFVFCGLNGTRREAVQLVVGCPGCHVSCGRSENGWTSELTKWLISQDWAETPVPDKTVLSLSSGTSGTALGRLYIVCRLWKYVLGVAQPNFEIYGMFACLLETPTTDIGVVLYLRSISSSSCGCMSLSSFDAKLTDFQRHLSAP